MGTIPSTRSSRYTYTLMVTYLGYDTLTKSVTVARDQIITEKPFTNSSSKCGNSRSPGRNRRHRAVEDERNELTPNRFPQRMPAIGGEADLV